jgi:hypothetical protein
LHNEETIRYKKTTTGGGAKCGFQQATFMLFRRRFFSLTGKNKSRKAGATRWPPPAFGDSLKGEVPVKGKKKHHLRGIHGTGGVLILWESQSLFSKDTDIFFM